MTLVTQEETGFTAAQVALIKSQIAPKATDDELQLFLHVAKRAGLDPFARQIYAIQRGGKMTIQTGIDGFRLCAARTREYAGSDDPVFDQEINDGTPTRASVTVWRFVQGERCAFTASARWSEYHPGNNPMWTKMPYTMLGKCAEALALRKAFPQELSGLYTGDEMDQAGSENLPQASVRLPAESDEVPFPVPSASEMLEHYCTVHGAPFTRKTNNKSSQVWWSHKVVGGGWCNEADVEAIEPSTAPETTEDEVSDPEEEEAYRR